MKIHQAMSLIVTILLAINFAWAESHRTFVSKNENAVQKLTGQEKIIRKKKAEMCSECGKPESDCECHGHDKIEHKETQVPSKRK